MRTVSATEARRKFHALIDEVSSGVRMSILRRGREVAWLIPPKSRRRRLPSLARFRASIHVTGEPASRSIMRARRDARY